MGHRAGRVGGSPHRGRRRAENSGPGRLPRNPAAMCATESSGPTPSGRPSGSPCMRGRSAVEAARDLTIGRQRRACLRRVVIGRACIRSEPRSKITRRRMGRAAQGRPVNRTCVALLRSPPRSGNMFAVAVPSPSAGTEAELELLAESTVAKDRADRFGRVRASGAPRLLGGRSGRGAEWGDLTWLGNRHGSILHSRRRKRGDRDDSARRRLPSDKARRRYRPRATGLRGRRRSADRSGSPSTIARCDSRPRRVSTGGIRERWSCAGSRVAEPPP